MENTYVQQVAVAVQVAVVQHKGENKWQQVI
jgi:hypothetical protein